MGSLLWLTDADNTLWDTDNVYRTAQLRLLARVERAVSIEGPAEQRLEFLRGIDQGLAQRDHRRLAYPKSMLVSAVSSVLLGRAIQVAIDRALRGDLTLDTERTGRITAEFSEDLKVCPRLRAGVRAGLEHLRRELVTVIVVTEGKKDTVERVLRETGLSGLIASVTAAEKSPSLYRRLSKLLAGGTTWMIGDQFDCDIIMAADAGLRAAYFPGGFQPAWVCPAAVLPTGCIEVGDYQEAVAHALSLKNGADLLN